eukprot:jgi/Mesen1/4836/ME000243S03995
MDNDAGDVEEQPGGRHIGKRVRRSGAAVVFDENARLEYLTGFRKRKQARRKKAEQEKEVKDRHKRLQERAERRLQVKIARGLLPPDATRDTRPTREDCLETEGPRGVKRKSDSIGEGDEEGTSGDKELVEQDTVIYEGEGTTTFVTTCALSTDGDDLERVPRAGSISGSAVARSASTVAPSLKPKSVKTSGPAKKKKQATQVRGVKGKLKSSKRKNKKGKKRKGKS